MSVPVDVALENVWKQYRLGRRGTGETFWALRDVGFEVPRGATLGVIGRNGAGKSTLLKLLAGITAPTRGRIVIHGRVAALIEVGSGFHPELTGRDNVFLSGSILGMRRREIAGKLERIVEFAGVGDFIDTPVKRYSSGMYVRLGFAVAAHLEPDVLLIDEVLSVGDAEFQVKCLQRLEELKERGTTNIFISHDLTAVERLCDSAVLLERGVIAARGEPADVVGDYHRRLALWDPGSGQTSLESPRSGVALTNLAIRSPDTPGAVTFQTGKPIAISVRYLVTSPLANVEFELRYYAADGKTRLATFATSHTGAELRLIPPGGTIEFACPALPFTPGTYFVGAIVRDSATSRVLAWWDGETRLYVHKGPAVEGHLQIPHTWTVRNAATDSPAVTTPASARERRHS
jgi:ABC-type polysaccharide/polyol phosphate transport system ATPase subunit